MPSSGVANGADGRRDLEGQALLGAGDVESSRRVLALAVLDVGKEVVGRLSSGLALNSILPGIHGVGLDDLEGVAGKVSIIMVAGEKSESGIHTRRRCCEECSWR